MHWPLLFITICYCLGLECPLKNSGFESMIPKTTSFRDEAFRQRLGLWCQQWFNPLICINLLIRNGLLDGNCRQMGHIGTSRSLGTCPWTKYDHGPSPLSLCFVTPTRWHNFLLPLPSTMMFGLTVGPEKWSAVYELKRLKPWA